MNETHHYEIGLTDQDGSRCVFVRRRIGDLTAIVAQEVVPVGIVELKIQASPSAYMFSYAIGDQQERILISCSTRYLSSEVAGGFTGVYIGMYATGNGEDATVPADFDWFEYQPL